MTMDAITLQRIQLLHPKVRGEALKAYTHANNLLLGKAVRLRFAYTYRSAHEQDTLYAQGRTHLFDAQGRRLGIVTNARGGLSVHNYGLAFDIVLLLDKDGNGTFEAASWDVLADHDRDGRADWQEVTRLFCSLGWAWGGNWKHFPDYPHFEKTFGLGVKELRARQAAGDTFTERINGKIYQWINL